MLKLKSAALSLALIMALPAAGYAADIAAPEELPAGWYLRGDAGWSWLNWDRRDDNEVVLGAGVGYRYNDSLRADLRVDWAGFYDTSASADDIAITTVLANMYYDFNMDERFSPYLGAGAGYGWVDTHGFDSSGFAFALMAGVTVDITDNISMDVGYRLREVLADDDTTEHQVMAGWRYSF